MTLPSEIAATMQAVFTRAAQQAATDSGFDQRHGPLGGPAFVQGVVFGCLDNPRPTLADFAQAAAAAGTVVQPQAFDQRFTATAADCLRRTLAHVVQHVAAGPPSHVPLLQRFSAVLVQDSTTVTLPDALAHLWRGAGGAGAQAAVQLQLRLDLRSGTLTGPFPHAGRASDQKSELQHDDLPAGAVRLADLGYFDLDTFARLAQGDAYFVSRWQYGTKLYHRDGRPLELRRWLARQGKVVDVPVLIGATHRLPGRLVTVRVPASVVRQRRKRVRQEARRRGQVASAARLALCRWTLQLTNIPKAKASAAEVVVLGRCRWQAELLIKLWKSDNGLDASRSQQPYRVLCEVYAKLIAAVVQHWLVLVGGWAQQPGRSLRKLAQVVRKQALMLVAALADVALLLLVCAVIWRCQQGGTRMHRSQQDPRTYQLLEEPERCADAFLQPPADS